MARIFPSQLPPKVPPEVARAFQKLKKLPDEFTLWFSIQPSSQSPQHPHFLLLWDNAHAFLIHVADTSQHLAESALQRDMLAAEQTTVEDLGQTEEGIIRDFEQSLNEQLDADLPVTKLIVFPNVEHGTIDAISLQRSAEADIQFLGLRQLSPLALPAFLIQQARSGLSDPQLVQLRARFTPESVIPKSFNPLQRAPSNTKAMLTHSLLDLDQEWIAKNNLYIPPEAEKLVHQTPDSNQEDIISQLVTGVAGSGKSLVLLYRALLNANLNPGADILVLTHNRPINNELRRRYQELNPKFKNVSWLTFFQWASMMLGSWDEETIYPARAELIIESLPKHGLSLSTSYIAEEIGYIKDLNITNKDEYFALNRMGRGTRLNTSQRQRIWKVAKDYHNHLVSNHLIDWHGVAMRFHQAAVRGSLALPGYDCILVDEAQFFAKAWFDVVRMALRPGGQLFLSADPTQGFLKRRQSWVSSGIDVRGRTTRLTKAYRNTQAILSYAKNFYDARSVETDEDEELNVPTHEQIAQIEHTGSYPEVIYCPSLQDCHRRVADEINKLILSSQRGHSGYNTIVLHAHSRQLPAFASVLDQLTQSRHHAHNAKLGVCPENAACQMSTLNAATGLEAPTVFLLGIDHLLDRENDPRFSAEEKSEMVMTHTKQLYMAFTRASSKLVILTSSQKTERFLKSLIPTSS